MEAYELVKSIKIYQTSWKHMEAHGFQKNMKVCGSIEEHRIA